MALSFNLCTTEPSDFLLRGEFGYVQLAGLLRRLKLLVEVCALQFGFIGDLEQTVPQCGFVENEHLEEGCAGCDMRSKGANSTSFRTCLLRLRRTISDLSGSNLDFEDKDGCTTRCGEHVSIVFPLWSPNTTDGGRNGPQ